jgi:hypothetical protein
MLQKKKYLLASAMLALGLPLAANADLITYNNTAQPSTVLVTSSIVPMCSSGLNPPGITPPYGKLDKGWDFVTLACIGSPGGICKANIYMTDHCGSDSDIVATAVLNTNATGPGSHSVTISPVAGSNYSITSDKSGDDANIYINLKK